MSGKLKTKLLIIWCLYFAGGAAVYFTVFASQIAKREQLAIRLTNKAHQLKVIEEAYQGKEVEKLTAQLDEKRQALEGFCVGFDTLPDLTLKISEMANELNLSSFSIKSRSDQVKKEIPGYKGLYQSIMDVSFYADFNTFARFVNTLERNRPVLFVDKFSISKTRHTSLDKNNPVQMTLSVYTRQTDNIAKSGGM